jgi:hypothetical protein
MLGNSREEVDLIFFKKFMQEDCQVLLTNFIKDIKMIDWVKGQTLSCIIRTLLHGNNILMNKRGALWCFPPECAPENLIRLALINVQNPAMLFFENVDNLLVWH